MRSSRRSGRSRDGALKPPSEVSEDAQVRAGDRDNETDSDKPRDEPEDSDLCQK